MNYLKTYKERSDAKRIAEMLALQEANQFMLEKMQMPEQKQPEAFNPADILKAIGGLGAQRSPTIGRNTYHNVASGYTRGYA